MSKKLGLVEAMKIKERMTNNCSIDCDDCPLFGVNNFSGYSCLQFISHCPEGAERVLMKWVEEHPPKTRLDDFMEKFPNNKCGREGIHFEFCCKSLGYCQDCYCDISKPEDCKDCWNEPVGIEQE